MGAGVPPGLQNQCDLERGRVGSIPTHSRHLIPRMGSVRLGARRDLGGLTEERGMPTHHDCRSTFLTHLANYADNGQGVKPHVLMTIAGHSSLATTMKYYVRASDGDLRAAMACVS